MKKSESVSCSFQFNSISQSCPTLRPHGLSGFAADGILQARILEWPAIPFSRESSWLRDRTWISHITGRFFIVASPGKPLKIRTNKTKTKKKDMSLQPLALLVKLIGRFVKIISEFNLSPVSYWPDCLTNNRILMQLPRKKRERWHSHFSNG